MERHSSPSPVRQAGNEKSKTASIEQTTMVSQLRLQRRWQLTNSLPSLKTALTNAKAQLSASLLDFQRIAAAHGIPVQLVETTQPHADHDQTTRALRYRIGGWACTILGILVFALACTASLSLPVPQIVLFLGCAVVGLLLGIAVDTATCLLTGASASNPAALSKIVLLGRISGAFAVLSAVLFLFLRFFAAGVAPLFVSTILVCFECSVFLLGGALEAGHALYSWSKRLSRNYQLILAERNELEHQLQVTELELNELTGISVQVESSKFQGEGYENGKMDQHDHSVHVDVAGRPGAKGTVNGSGRLGDVDGLARP
jgi:hypothetical protein